MYCVHSSITRLRVLENSLGICRKLSITMRKQILILAGNGLKAAIKRFYGPYNKVTTFCEIESLYLFNYALVINERKQSHFESIKIFKANKRIGM